MHPIEAINKKIALEIQAFADKHGITYKEAAERSYLVVNGRKIEPIDSKDLEINLKRNST